MSLFTFPITKCNHPHNGRNVNVVAKPSSSQQMILAFSPYSSEDTKFQNILAATRPSSPSPSGGGFSGSSKNNGGGSNNHNGNGNGRELLSDRQKPFTHLKPKNFVMGYFRIVGKSSSVILAEYMSDKLKHEMKNEELVNENILTSDEADKDNEEWGAREWEKRWKDFFEKKVLHAWLRYHAVTITTRFYEYVCSLSFSDVTLDKLTTDMFQAAIRYDRNTTTTKEQPDTKKSIGSQMASTCFWSNILVYLADYSVSQILLIYGYYYWYNKIRPRNGSNYSSSSNSSDTKDASKIQLHSIRLIISRSVSLVSASIGGAIGSMFYPGWGTLIGFNMGDGLAYSMIDEGM